jgi:ABC-type nitrate/sulfonate/bicarbonate transport system substrate-binding protein
MYLNHGKKIALLVSLVMIVLVSPVAAEENRSELPTVKIVYWRSIDDLPLYVGVEKGFFKDAGVNVALEFIKGEPNALAAVLRGDVNGGYISLASLIKLSEKKVPVKVVMWMGHAHSGTKCGIHVGAQTKYKTLQDLKGIRLATGGSINSKTMLTHALAKGGYAMQDIRPLWSAEPDNPMQYEAALRSGGVDAFIV